MIFIVDKSRVIILFSMKLNDMLRIFQKYSTKFKSDNKLMVRYDTFIFIKK
jgi:hypothetical protein